MNSESQIQTPQESKVQSPKTPSKVQERGSRKAGKMPIKTSRCSQQTHLPPASSYISLPQLFLGRAAGLLSRKQPHRPPVCLSLLCSPCPWIGWGRELFLVRGGLVLSSPLALCSCSAPAGGSASNQPTCPTARRPWDCLILRLGTLHSFGKDRVLPIGWSWFQLLLLQTRIQ